MWHYTELSGSCNGFTSHVTAGVYWRAFIRVNLSNINTILKKVALKTNLSPKHGLKSILLNSVMTAKCKSISWVIKFILLFCVQRPIVPVSALGRTSADKVTFTDKEHDQSSSHTNTFCCSANITPVDGSSYRMTSLFKYISGITLATHLKNKLWVHFLKWVVVSKALVKLHNCPEKIL